MANLRKIAQKNWTLKSTTKYIVSWTCLLILLGTALDSALNGIKFKKKILLKFTINLIWNFEGFLAFSPDF